MSASATSAAREAPAYYFRNRLRVGEMNAGKGANKRLGGVKFQLVFIIGEIRGALAEPFAGGLFQDRRERNPAVTGPAFEIGLEFARQGPAVDFGFHALQCSAKLRCCNVQAWHGKMVEWERRQSNRQAAQSGQEGTADSWVEAGSSET